MKIGLIDIEPNIVNTALMQISTYHKKQGDIVEWATPLTYHCYDKLYCSSLFDFTDKTQLPPDSVRGGSGFDLTTDLPDGVENCDYDYSMYPACDYSIVWFSRGCIRKCPFCLVWKKEGGIRSVQPKKLNPNGKYIKIQDNNFFANPDWKLAFADLMFYGQKVSFSSGIDVRIITKEQCDAINRLKLEGQIHIAWDNPKDDITDKLNLLTKYIKPYKIMCYVLIGYWSTPEEDLYRVETLRSMGIDPFVMPYNKKDTYQKRFARWVNHKAIFKTVKWQDYI